MFQQSFIRRERLAWRSRLPKTRGGMQKSETPGKVMRVREDHLLEKEHFV
jgi:hypothetical protein